MSILSVASDKDLFKYPPPKDECPICYRQMEFLANTSTTNYDRMETYLPCCRKMICYGCFDEISDRISRRNLKRKCVLCRKPFSGRAELAERYKERMEANDVHAFNDYALHHVLGFTPLPGHPKTKEELELLKRGANIGSIDANYYLGEAYWYEVWNNISDLLSKKLGLLRDEDISVPYTAAVDILSRWLKKEEIDCTVCELSLLKQVVNLVHSSHDIAEYLARVVNLRDIEKAVYHYEIAAMGGNEKARFWLGEYEWSMGNTSRSIKHFMIAAKCGHNKSLKMVVLVELGYRQGQVTKDDYASALRAHQRSQDERAGYKSPEWYRGDE